MLDMLNQNETARMLAPVVGAAGGTLAIPALAEKIGMPPEQVAFASAIVVLTLAQNAHGALKSALGGAAAAGVCLGIRELLDKHRPRVDTVPATPPDAISRADLGKALSDLHAQLTAQAREREEAQLQQFREMQEMLRTLVAQLKSAHAEIDRLHADAARRHAPRDASARPRVYSVPAETTAPEPVSMPANTEAPDEPTTTTLDVPAEELDAMQAVYSLLDERDREELSRTVASMPPADAQQLRARFAGADPHDAAATIRAYLADTRSAS